MTFEYSESKTLQNKIPAFGTIFVDSTVSLTTCASICVQRKPCQMVFYNAETRICILYDFLVWNGTLMEVSFGYRALRLLNEGILHSMMNILNILPYALSF